MQGRERFYRIVSKDVGSSEMTGIGDSDRLRSRANHMLELANRAKLEKNTVFACLLTQLAAEAFEHAGEIEQSDTVPRRRAVKFSGISEPSR